MNFTLSDIPVYFNTVDELREYVSDLVFFDDHFNPIQSRWNAMNGDTPPEVVLRSNQEMLIMQKFLNIHYYKNIEEGFTKTNFKNKILKGAISYDSEADEVLGIIKGMGVKVTPEEWEMYETVFNELFDLEPIKE